MSGSGVVSGCGGPNEASSRSAAAVTIGHAWGAMNMAPCMPKPHVKVSRSRTVTGRSASTVSVRGPSGRRSTRRPASSGSRSSAGPFRSSRPSSTRLSTTAAVIGLVVDEMRNKVSVRIGGPPAAITPAALIYVVSPWATAATTPGAWPCATAASTAASILSWLTLSPCATTLSAYEGLRSCP